MKRNKLSILLIAFYYYASAQDFYTTINTPTGMSINALYRTEFSADQLAQIEADAADWITSHHSNAVRIAAASRTYNCHNYAWHNSDGGNRIWINQYNQNGSANISKYWTGSLPTYQLTTPQNANKAFYSSGDHSAKVISTTLFESKWGAWPRYQHSPTDCPYNHSNIQYYYVPINGNGFICSSTTYSVVNISGASYNWIGNNISINGTGSTITASKLLNGSGWIQAQITSPYSGTVISSKKQAIRLGTPSSPNTIINFCCNGMGFISESLYNFWVDTQNANQFNWIVNGGTIINGQGTNVISVLTSKAPSQGINFDVSVRAGNECGWSSYLQRSGYTAPVIGRSYTIYPNPSNWEVTISLSNSTISFENTSKDENLILSIKITDLFGNIKKTLKYGSGQKSVTINVSGLNKGVYLIIINNGSYEETQNLVIQ